MTSETNQVVDGLIARLRDLSLLEIDGLVEGENTQELLAAFVEDVADALQEARELEEQFADQLKRQTIDDGWIAHLHKEGAEKFVERQRVEGLATSFSLREWARLIDSTNAVLPVLRSAVRRLSSFSF